MNPDSEKALTKLAKGKDKLSLDDIMAFLADARSFSKEEVAAAIAPKRKASTRKPASTPAWIADVQKEFKLVGWSKSNPGPNQLVEYANASGKLSKTIPIPKSLSLPSACKKIAAELGDDAARRMAFDLVEQKRKAGARS